MTGAMRGAWLLRTLDRPLSGDIGFPPLDRGGTEEVIPR